MLERNCALRVRYSYMKTDSTFLTKEKAEKLISSLESGHAGIEAFLALRADDRTTIMAMLEQRTESEEVRQIIEQCVADGTMDKIRAFLAEHGKKNKQSQDH